MSQGSESSHPFALIPISYGIPIGCGGRRAKHVVAAGDDPVSGLDLSSAALRDQHCAYRIAEACCSHAEGCRTDDEGFKPTMNASPSGVGAYMCARSVNAGV